MATHFALVLGAWRLRVRIDIDEPREDVVESGTAADDRPHHCPHSHHFTRPAVSAAPPWN